MVHKKITIQRYAIPDLRRERKAYVFYPDGKSVPVDPQLEIQFATGVWMPRHACMLSMADGMMAAGSTVTFGVYSPKPDNPNRHPCVNPYKYTRFKHIRRPDPIPAYFLLGFALSHDLWFTHYKPWLQLVPRFNSLAILELNAQRLMANAFDSTELSAPLHLLIA
ncbi:hypothetical protein IT407_01105 [Candidatus Uhrbacteria bacterium]|nr:hypothetical protein [Candidatus Uhrbacteria bacterium]